MHEELTQHISGFLAPAPLLARRQPLSDLPEDVHERLELFTMSDAMKIDKPSWLVEGLISSSLTLVSGKPKSGKSGLAQNLVAAILTHGSFLGRPILREVRRVIVIGTDPDAVIEYRDRLTAAGVTVSMAGDRLVMVKALRLNRQICRALAEQLGPDENDLLILDHLSDMEGDFNSQADVADIFSNIRAAARDATTVVLAHSSTATGPNGHSTKKPLGSTVIEGKARWIVHVEARGADRRVLTTRGNSGRGEVLQLDTGGHAADFCVDSVERVDTQQAAKRRVRNKATLDKRGEQYRWYQANCRGLSKAEASRRLSTEFGDSPTSWANRLTPTGWLGQMVNKP